ncbi:MAG: glycine zipper 2TM domain-containing protein [Betaproteobacteria bacterium]|nr:glycine zipper 2TM domain-containing protein [Betaproteobacteria bacterium]
MDAEAKTKIHPLVVGASIAVIVLSLVGIAALTGYLPGTSAQKTSDEAATASTAPSGAPAAPAPAVTPSAPPRQAKPAHKPAIQSAPREPVAAPREQIAAAPPAVQQPKAVCADCGTVSDVKEIEVKGEGSGMGAVAGGVAGAIIGNQFGRGGSKTVARLAGAAGGAYAGHQIEKEARSHKRYDVIVRMEAGGERTVSYEAAPTWRVGDRVRVVDGKLELDR